MSARVAAAVFASWLCGALLFAPCAASAEPPPPDSDVAQAPATPAVEAARSAPAEIPLEQWQPTDWMLVKPRVSLFELHGNYRLRGDNFHRLKLGNNVQWEDVDRYKTNASGSRGDLSSTNMRLRLEPQINISENVRLVATFDVLENLSFGSTPDSVTLPFATTPLNVLSRGQQPARRGFNSVTDSLVAKRVYAVMEALRGQLELRFGRMPDHFGLGMLYNHGDCLDCDYGQVADRIAVTFKAAGHLFTPMIDWVSSGPTAAPFASNAQGQPVDAANWDDTMQYALRIQRLDHPQEIWQARARGETVINYGWSNAIRMQTQDAPASFYPNGVYDPQQPLYQAASGATAEISHPSQRRDAMLYTSDAYVKIIAGGFELSAEGALIRGSFRDLVLATDTELKKTHIMQLGAALEATYRFNAKQYRGTVLSFKTGGASGDSYGGFGALDRAFTQRGLKSSGAYDLNLKNFQFSPDYHVDLLLFRRILGTVTDAWYAKPSVAYIFDDKVQGSFSAIYSQAVYKSSTPGRALPLGLEFDTEISYGMARPDDLDGFKASLAGGLLFPMAAFDNPLQPAGDQSPSFAWTLQARLYLTF